MLIHHLGDLFLSHISLSEILEDLLELLHVHGPVLVSVVALEGVLQLYREIIDYARDKIKLPVISCGVKCFFSSKLTSYLGWVDSTILYYGFL
jgi:hypothetical protein